MQRSCKALVKQRRLLFFLSYSILSIQVRPPNPGAQPTLNKLLAALSGRGHGCPHDYLQAFCLAFCTTILSPDQLPTNQHDSANAASFMLKVEYWKMPSFSESYLGNGNAASRARLNLASGHQLLEFLVSLCVFSRPLHTTGGHGVRETQFKLGSSYDVSK